MNTHRSQMASFVLLSLATLCAHAQDALDSHMLVNVASVDLGGPVEIRSFSSLASASNDNAMLIASSVERPLYVVDPLGELLAILKPNTSAALDVTRCERFAALWVSASPGELGYPLPCTANQFHRIAPRAGS
jgi:hypothetical protein